MTKSGKEAQQMKVFRSVHMKERRNECLVYSDFYELPTANICGRLLPHEKNARKYGNIQFPEKLEFQLTR
jgi:hypothetical protein